MNYYLKNTMSTLVTTNFLSWSTKDQNPKLIDPAGITRIVFTLFPSHSLFQNPDPLLLIMIKIFKYES